MMMSEKKRVAAYRRLKIESPDSTTSYTFVRDYAQNSIARHENWELTAIFIDEGGGKSRPELNRLLEDCRRGKVDMILTKDIFSFGRNTVDALEIIRRLSRLKSPVDVYFTDLNLHSLDAGSCERLAMLATFAAMESHYKNTARKPSVQQCLDFLKLMEVTEDEKK
jgi:DNA invertase Pin-like site-specific DNA recombinase